MYSKFTAKLNNEEVTIYRIENDINGNPRYIIHFLAITKDYNNKKLNKAGFKKYRAGWFGGGLVFSSYNVEDDLKYMYDVVNS